EAEDREGDVEDAGLLDEGRDQSERGERDQFAARCRKKCRAAHREQREKDGGEDRDRPAQRVVVEEKVRGGDGQASRQQHERVTATPGERGKHKAPCLLYEVKHAGKKSKLRLRSGQAPLGRL